MNKKLFLYLLAAIMLIYGVIDYIDYNKKNLDVTGFYFECYGVVCEIKHKKANGDVKYTEKVDINKIEKFRTKLEKVPRTNKDGLVIYADRKDGTSYRFSPIYVEPSIYVETELIKPLNEAIKKKQIMIHKRFP